MLSPNHRTQFLASIREEISNTGRLTLYREDHELSSDDIAWLFGQLTVEEKSQINYLDFNFINIDLRNLTDFLNCPNILALNLGYQPISQEKFAVICTQHQLESLSINGTDLSSIDFLPISNLKALKNLQLIACELSDEKLTEIKQLPLLTSVELTRNPGLSDFELFNAFFQHKALREFRCDDDFTAQRILQKPYNYHASTATFFQSQHSDATQNTQQLKPSY